MLVCNVSLRPPRSAIAAAIAEATAAVDATATDNVVFATLVDDPASVGDFVDAYSGDIMLEAASADDSVTVAGGVVAAAIDESATAVADAPDATVSGAASSRSAMVIGPTFVNTGTSREANVNGTQVNL